MSDPVEIVRGTVLVRGVRTFLRHPIATDEAEYQGLRRKSATFHRPWEPSVPPGIDPYGPEAFRNYLLGGQDGHRERTLLCRTRDSAILGAFNLNEIVRGAFQSAYLGYWIGVPFARRGYMREGLELFLEHAFNGLGLHRLEANIRPENEASIALVKRAGFRLEGYSPAYLQIAGSWRDHERWAILAEEWQVRRDLARP